MDKKRSILNVSVSIISRIILLFAGIIVRRLLIQYIGNYVNGLNSLFGSIIGTLSVAELGIGRAIVYSMYNPIVKGDDRQVSALFHLYEKVYRVIGLVILIGGLGVMPFLPYMISDYEKLNVNVYITFLLTLISVLVSYLYSAKTSIIEAHKDNYITTSIMTVSHLVKYCLQAIAIVLLHSFVVFLLCLILETIIVWVLTELVVKRKYKEIIEKDQPVDEVTKKEIWRNSKAMVMHKIGSVLVAGIDSIIISSFVGIVILGKYSNYIYVASVMVGIITLFFTPLTSVIGHLCATGNSDTVKKEFDNFYSMNYILGIVFFLGYYAVIDDVVKLLFGTGLELSHKIVFIMTVNQFISYMRQASLLFRNASGTFYNDRWKPIAEGLSNLILSLLFVNIFPEDFQVVGVIVATIITSLLICDTVEPFVIFKHVFNSSPKRFYIKNYVFIGAFVCTLVCEHYLIREVKKSFTGIVVNGFVSIGISICLIGLISLFDKVFRMSLLSVLSKFVRLMKRSKVTN